LAFLGAQLVRENELQRLETRAQSAARAVDFRIGLGIELNDQMFEPFADAGDGEVPASVVVHAPDGTVYQAGSHVEGRSQSVEATSDQGATVVLYVSWWEVFWLSARVIALVVIAA